MKYQYFKKIESEEHYLYANEAAEYLFHTFGFSSMSGNPHVKLVAAWLDQLEREGDESDNDKLFYIDKRGTVRRVYKKVKELAYIAKLLADMPPKDYVEINIKGTSYKFKIKFKEGETNDGLCREH